MRKLILLVAHRLRARSRHRYILLGLFVVLFLCLESGHGYSLEVAIRAPVGCRGGAHECSADISLKEARNRASSTPKCVEKITIGSHNITRYRRGQCVSKASTNDYDDRVGATGYFWADAKDLQDGADRLAELAEHAKSEKPFLVNDDYFQIVEAVESPPLEQHLALCPVIVINGNVGPPLGCVTVAIISPTVTLLRADLSPDLANRSAPLHLVGVFRQPVRGRTMCYIERSTGRKVCQQPVQATFRISGLIDINFLVHTDLSPSVISDSIARMLKEDLGFSDDQIERDVSEDNETNKIYEVSFRSTAPLRESTILKGGWREALDLDININASDTKTIGVHGMTSPMVCRQASGQLIDYHAPNDAQRATYATELNRNLGRAIMRACNQSNPSSTVRFTK